MFLVCLCIFFVDDPALPGIYTLSLHDALPIWWRRRWKEARPPRPRSRPPPNERPKGWSCEPTRSAPPTDRKSTRLNSSHRCISYAVFCLKKKKKETQVYNDMNKNNTKPKIVYS